MTCTAERASAPCCTGQAFLPGCECGSAECDPGVGDVVAGARQGEGLQGAGGEFLGAAGVAVAQQELGARVPDLRAFQGFAEAFRELFGLGEVAFGFVAVACAEPRSSQRVQALQDAARVGDLTAQPERFTVVVLGCGPFLLGLGDSAEVGEDRAVDHAVAVGFGHALQEFQGVTESGLGGAGCRRRSIRWRPRCRNSGRAGWHLRCWPGREPNARNAALH